MLRKFRSTYASFRRGVGSVHQRLQGVSLYVCMFVCMSPLIFIEIVLLQFYSAGSTQPAKNAIIDKTSYFHCCNFLHSFPTI